MNDDSIPPTSNPMNIGHGHVFPRPDGVKARCGGPGLCAPCSVDLARKLANESQKNPQQPPDRFRKVEGHAFRLLLCRLCRSPAELWQRWERDDVWHSFACCTNLEDVDGEPCTFHLPDAVQFYRERKREAVDYWNLMMGPRKGEHSPDETKAGEFEIGDAVSVIGILPNPEASDGWKVTGVAYRPPLYILQHPDGGHCTTSAEHMRRTSPLKADADGAPTD